MSSPIAAVLDAAQQHFHAGRLDDAAKLLRDIVEADPANDDALEGLAYIAANRRDSALAADHFDRAIAHLPATAGRLRGAGTVNQAAGRHARRRAV
jgi:Tfp pilus assembly protein PilF